MTRSASTSALLSILFAILVGSVAFGEPTKGPLRVHPKNPRYFADVTGKAVYLTGAHTWNNLPDMSEISKLVAAGGPPLSKLDFKNHQPKPMDYAAYLDYMEGFHHNFMRMWAWETWVFTVKGWGQDRRVHVWPHPWARTGPGEALDRRPKFDLTKFDQRYFKRLRSRVEEAGKRGIYVSVMLFEGWGISSDPEAGETHPFNSANNVNGINGDSDGDGKLFETHQLVDPKITALQEAYVRKVIDTVNDLDNVLYEISNEDPEGVKAWQYHMVNFIKKYEKTKPKQHPVGMTAFHGGGMEALFESPADWISPAAWNGGWNFKANPPANDGRKVIFSDTDHLWGIGGNMHWVWGSFTRGHQPIFMDPYDATVLGKSPFEPHFREINLALGDTRRYAERMNLSAMTPQPDVASSEYCLADPGKEYLVYLPEKEGGKVTVDLRAAKGKLVVEWFDLHTRKTKDGGQVDGGTIRSFVSPFGDARAVLYIRSGV
jgi:hypothetical protein